MSRRARPHRLTFRAIEAAFSLVFLGVVVHHAGANDFRPLAALCAPILILYYGFSSLLFVRGRALAEGPWQVRSLYAAEAAMQATVWHVLGVVLGVIAYGALRHVQASADTGSHAQIAMRLLLFAAPYALMQAGLLSFMRAVRAVAPQFVRRTSAFEIRRRVVAGRG